MVDSKSSSLPWCKFQYQQLLSEEVNRDINFPAIKEEDGPLDSDIEDNDETEGDIPKSSDDFSKRNATAASLIGGAEKGTISISNVTDEVSSAVKVSPYVHRTVDDIFYGGNYERKFEGKPLSDIELEWIGDTLLSHHIRFSFLKTVIISLTLIRVL